MRNICVITGTRADYGLLSGIMYAIKSSDEFELQIIASCMHLSEDFGLTYKEIERDGYIINEKIDMLLPGNSTLSVSKSIGKGVIAFADAYERLKPDLIIILGDRFEALSAAQTAMIANIPIAHIHGGEVTEGAIDESIRHAITKMSSIHFTTTKEASSRVRQMGEDPEQIVVTGSPGIDQIFTVPLMERASFFDSLGLKPQKRNFIITLHPETLSKNNKLMAHAMLSALNAFSNIGLIFTGSNADPGAAELDEIISTWAAKRKNAVFYKSLGSSRYFSALKHCDLVLGNSSSGLYEAASFGTPTVNIGDRQARRVRPISVFDCRPEVKDIYKAIDSALTKDWSGIKSPYGDGQAALRIVSYLASVTNPAALIRKSFKDLEYG